MSRVANFNRQGCAVVTLLALLIAPFGIAAQEADKDGPPPPGALLREFGGGPVARSASDALPVPGSTQPLSAPVEIPFLLEGGHMMIEASVDGGAKQLFLFDTGGRLLLTPEAARAVKPSTSRQVMLGGVGPAVRRASIVTLNRLSVGSLVLDNQSAVIAELPNWIVDRGAKTRLAGLIGSELIASRMVTIDYRKRVMTLQPSGQIHPGANASVAKLGFSLSPEGLGHPSITASVGGVEAVLLVDTGATGGLFLSEKFITAHNPFRPGGKIVRFMSPGGVGGPLQMQAGVGTTFKLGTAVFNAPILNGPVAADRSLGQLKVAGIIGAEILSRFVMTLDFPGKRAWFEPIPGTAPASSWHSVGAILSKPDPSHFEVIDVLPGTPAERAGIRRGDKIVSYGGQPARSLGLRDLGRFSGKPVSLVMADERRHDLGPVQILP